MESQSASGSYIILLRLWITHGRLAPVPAPPKPPRSRRISAAKALVNARLRRIASASNCCTTLRAAADMAELKPQLRALLHYHCGVGSLRTRQMLIDLQSL